MSVDISTEPFLQPPKRQAKKNQNETQPSKDNKNPQLTTKDWDGNSAVAGKVGEVSEKGGTQYINREIQWKFLDSKFFKITMGSSHANCEISYLY